MEDFGNHNDSKLEVEVFYMDALGLDHHCFPNELMKPTECYISDVIGFHGCSPP